MIIPLELHICNQAFTLLSLLPHPFSVSRLTLLFLPGKLKLQVSGWLINQACNLSRCEQHSGQNVNTWHQHICSWTPAARCNMAPHNSVAILPEQSRKKPTSYILVLELPHLKLDIMPDSTCGREGKRYILRYWAFSVASYNCQTSQFGLEGLACVSE